MIARTQLSKRLQMEEEETSSTNLSIIVSDQYTEVIRRSSTFFLLVLFLFVVHAPSDRKYKTPDMMVHAFHAYDASKILSPVSVVDELRW